MPLKKDVPLSHPQAVALFGLLTKSNTFRNDVFKPDTTKLNVESRFTQALDSYYGAGFTAAFLATNAGKPLDVKALLPLLVDTRGVTDYLNTVYAASYTPCDMTGKVKSYLDGV